MHDLGALVWALFVVAAVVSSAIGSFRKQLRRQTALLRDPSGIAPIAAPRSVPPSPPEAAPPGVPAVTVRTPAAQPQPRIIRTGAARGLFEERGAWVRAVIASEVLGPPKALREQSFWSPSHSEPSI
jgi:hypothetical protein